MANIRSRVLTPMTGTRFLLSATATSFAAAIAFTPLIRQEPFGPCGIAVAFALATITATTVSAFTRLDGRWITVWHMGKSYYAVDSLISAIVFTLPIAIAKHLGPDSDAGSGWVLITAMLTYCIVVATLIKNRAKLLDADAMDRLDPCAVLAR